jgi:quercetin dioxygenase-like cupin family protein
VASVATTDASGRPLGRLDATLITTAIDVPEPGDEIRISTLVFSFGEGGESQVVVGGTAVYPAQGATLATGAVPTRPIQGGSGRFAGASGWAVSEHLEDGTWRHTLTLTRTSPGMHAGIRGFHRGPAGSARAVLRERLAEGLRERVRVVLRPQVEARSTEPGIVRTALGAAQPGSAPGHDLGLWHYTIPAGAALEPHRHPGWQIARIARGELSYTIISGEAEVLAADGSSRIIGLGTHALRTGDSVIEHPDLEHYGANLTDRDVEILAATLYPEGAPLAIPVAIPSPDPQALPSASPGP